MARTLGKKAQQQELLRRVALGEYVVEVCEDLKIARSQPWRWAEDDEDFRGAYARARQLQAHALAEQTLQIAEGNDSLSRAWRIGLEALADEVDQAEPKDRKAVRALLNALENGFVQRNRLRVDTHKWFTSKIAPRTYGERVEVVGDGGGPVRQAMTVTFVTREDAE